MLWQCKSAINNIGNMQNFRTHLWICDCCCWSCCGCYCCCFSCWCYRCQSSCRERYFRCFHWKTCVRVILAFSWLPGGFLPCYVASVVDEGLLKNTTHLELTETESAVVDIVFALSFLQTILLASVDKAKVILIRGGQIFKTWKESKSTITGGSFRSPSSFPQRVPGHQNEARFRIKIVRVMPPLLPLQLIPI